MEAESRNRVLGGVGLSMLTFKLSRPFSSRSGLPGFHLTPIDCLSARPKERPSGHGLAKHHPQ